MQKALKVLMTALVLLFACSAAAQTPSTAPKAATDVTAAAIQEFLKGLPRDAIADWPIRTVDVGGPRIGVFGVFRPKALKQDAVLHEVKTTEVYYMLEGGATLVTGGALMDQRKNTPTDTTVRGSRIDGGVSRRVVKGDVVIIPGRVPHWWTAMDGDIQYLILRFDPEGKLTLK